MDSQELSRWLPANCPTPRFLLEVDVGTVARCHFFSTGDPNVIVIRDMDLQRWEVWYGMGVTASPDYYPFDDGVSI